MKKRIFAAIIMATATCVSPLQAQKTVRPKLVVGMVVDQMRWDYLYRYRSLYGEGGFNRLLNEGYSCENTRIPYVPSVTAVGHTCIYTGSVPSIHGIAGNNFVKDGKQVYCTDDNTVTPVGTKSKAALMSPRNLWTTTIGDEMKIATNGLAKVVGVALKERASILPAGHSADGAYWFDDETGNFVTSSFYMDRLPSWVNTFNHEKHPAHYLSSPWTTLYDASAYTESTADANNYEEEVRPGVNATLPLDLPALYKKYGYSIIRHTPFGNSLTLDLAKAAVEGEQLGADDETDLLTVSCSSTDYIGHQVGTHAVEIEDTYLRLDRDLADFFTFLDKKVGRGNWLLFLSADHGAMNNACYLQDRRIPAGYWSKEDETHKLNDMLHKTYPSTPDLVKTVMNYQVFLNHDVISSNHLNLNEIKQILVDSLKADNAVLYACDMETALTAPIPDDIRTRIVNGYCRGRSGDISVVLKPNWNDHDLKGTDHGSWNPYDTHIPLVFLGWGIEHGATTRPTCMTDICATIAAILHIQAPNGCVGQPIF